MADPVISQHVSSQGSCTAMSLPTQCANMHFQLFLLLHCVSPSLPLESAAQIKQPAASVVPLEPAVVDSALIPKIELRGHEVLCHPISPLLTSFLILLRCSLLQNLVGDTSITDKLMSGGYGDAEFTCHSNPVLYLIEVHFRGQQTASRTGHLSALHQGCMASLAEGSEEG